MSIISFFLLSDGIQDTCMNRSTYRNNHSMVNMMMIDNRLEWERKTTEKDVNMYIELFLMSFVRHMNKSSGKFSKWHLLFSFHWTTRISFLTCQTIGLLLIELLNENTTPLTFIGSKLKITKENTKIKCWKSILVNNRSLVRSIWILVFLVYLFVSYSFSISVFCYFFLYHKYIHTVVDIVLSSQWTYHLSQFLFFYYR